MTFAQKHIDVSFELASGQFDGGGNSHTVKGLRVSTAIDVPGGAANAHAAIAIWGLSLSTMNQLTILPTDLTQIGRNTVTISAYEEGQQPATCFKGTVYAAFVDARAQPQVSFHVEAQGALYEQVAPAKVVSAPGSQDVSKLMGQIAKDAGFQFEDNGVNVKIMNPYYFGSATGQILKLAEDANIHHVIDRGTLAIWPRGQARKGDTIALSPKTGMVGYPRFSSSGLEITSIFNPQIQYGCKVNVQSELTPACGEWICYNVAHDLDAEMPNGKWFTTISTSKVGVTSSQ